jgi:hypothetical protein
MRLLFAILAAATVQALPGPQPQVAKGGGSSNSQSGGPNLGTFASGGLAGLVGFAGGSVPLGPIPKGCSAHEIVVGMFLIK